MIKPKIDIEKFASEDLMAHYFTTREGMTKRDLGPPAQRVMEVLLRISFLQGRTEAPVRRLEWLADAAIIHKGNLRRVLDDLVKGDVIIERYDGEFFHFEVKPDWETWHLPRRHTHTEEGAAERALKFLIEEPDPGQLELIERSPDIGAEVSRAFSSVRGRTGAVADDGVVVVPGTTKGPVVRGTTSGKRAVVPGTTRDASAGARGDSQIVQIGDSYESGDSGSSPTKVGRSESARAAPTAKRFRDEEKNYLVDELRSLDPREFENEVSRRTWVARIRDCGPFVHRAMAEVRSEMREGKKYQRPLGKVFLRARDYAKAAGKKLSMFFA